MSDVWDLRVDIAQKQQMILTVDEYRNFLKPLVLIINAQWVSLGELTATERVNAVEKMIHKTTDNPNPKHSYFQRVINHHPTLGLGTGIAYLWMIEIFLECSSAKVLTAH